MSYLFLFLFGTAVGVMSGLLGIGGGVALVPGLMLLFGFSQQEAQGTSLAVLVPPIGIFAAMVYYQHGFVRAPIVGWIALGFLLGALGGAKLVPVVPVLYLRIGFGLILLYVGFMFVMTPTSARSSSRLARRSCRARRLHPLSPLPPLAPASRSRHGPAQQRD